MAWLCTLAITIELDPLLVLPVLPQAADSISCHPTYYYISIGTIPTRRLWSRTQLHYPRQKLANGTPPTKFCIAQNPKLNPFGATRLPMDHNNYLNNIVCDNSSIYPKHAWQSVVFHYAIDAAQIPFPKQAFPTKSNSAPIPTTPPTIFFYHLFHFQIPPYFKISAIHHGLPPILQKSTD